jgi:sugar-specific transcriptional regulator TrmB
MSLLSVDITNIEKILGSELKLSANESRTFLLIVKNGKMTPRRIHDALQITLPEARRAADSLVNKGMLIEVSPTEYESLHPRFAASNRYKILCEEENIEFKKNIKIDNIGLILEGHFENARTK